MEKKKLSIKEIGIEKLVVIFLCGIFLLALSLPKSGDNSQKNETASLGDIQTTGVQLSDNKVSSSTQEYEERMENKIEEILKEVEGIGDVKVMITVKSSKEKVTLKDSPYSKETVKESDSAGGTRESQNIKTEEETVLVDGNSQTSVPYVLKEIEPEIEGVLVLAGNGNNAALKKEIMEAVQVLFDVPSHKIKVMKMQENE